MIKQTKIIFIVSTLLLSDNVFSCQVINKRLHSKYCTYIDLRIHTKNQWCIICKNNKINIYTMDAIGGLDVKYKYEEINNHNILLCKYLCGDIDLKRCKGNDIPNFKRRIDE